ncbi:MAG: NAD(P)/FAD-dependent oxidoreductase [Muribaculaceae bacterium]|nr:NAD(P)/FAD-dependent oxidoreductase [Muribaculaceae bacterium]
MPLDSLDKKKTVIIAGGGPAGLTLAWELASRSDAVRPLLFEASDMLGGISRTVPYKGNRIDIGGHRFFSRSQRVRKLWDKIMPIQHAPALDELLLGASPATTDVPAEANPELASEVMLRRRRVSRIYYRRRFFDYPVSLSLRTLRAMGPWGTIASGFGYLTSRFRPRPETNLENFYINRFGAPLYHMFFEDYTEKVWGLHPSALGAEWGAQRVKGLSVRTVLADMFARAFRRRDPATVQTSLIGEFIYPRLGPGQFWETLAREASARGAEIALSTPVRKVHIGPDRRVCAVSVHDPSAQGGLRRIPCDAFASSLPLGQLVRALDGIDIPHAVAEVADGLPYRDFITVGLLIPELKIKNKTALRTFASRIPDTWIYVQDRGVRLGRIQVFNNWSPYMVADFRNTVWIGLEYFCTEGDEFWQMDDSSFIRFAASELEKIGIIDAADVIDSIRIRVPKAYPSYFGTYSRLHELREFLAGIPNLYCIGRNGQHRYNNMDHSMLTAMVAADCILDPSLDPSVVWDVNTTDSYHEA